MICKECGAKMYVDDRDRSFKGCEDIYWNCPNCQTSCIEEDVERYYKGGEQNGNNSNEEDNSSRVG